MRQLVVCSLGFAALFAGDAAADAFLDAVDCHAKLEAGVYEDAVASCLSALDAGTLSESNIAITANNLGRARLRLGDARNAEIAFTRAIEADKTYAHPVNNRGIARAELGDAENALIDFDRAVELDPDYTRARFNRGKLRLASGDPYGALEDVTHVLSSQPNLNAAVTLRDKVLAKLGLPGATVATADVAASVETRSEAPAVAAAPSRPADHHPVLASAFAPAPVVTPAPAPDAVIALDAPVEKPSEPVAAPAPVAMATALPAEDTPAPVDEPVVATALPAEDTPAPVDEPVVAIALPAEDTPAPVDEPVVAIVLPAEDAPAHAEAPTAPVEPSAAAALLDPVVPMTPPSMTPPAMPSPVMAQAPAPIVPAPVVAEATLAGAAETAQDLTRAIAPPEAPEVVALAAIAAPTMDETPGVARAQSDMPPLPVAVAEPVMAVSGPETAPSVSTALENEEDLSTAIVTAKRSEPTQPQVDAPAPAAVVARETDLMTVADFERAIREGLRSVAATQAALTELGYKPGPVDGLYGRRTRAALEQCLADKCALAYH